MSCFGHTYRVNLVLTGKVMEQLKSPQSTVLHTACMRFICTSTAGSCNREYQLGSFTNLNRVCCPFFGVQSISLFVVS